MRARGAVTIALLVVVALLVPASAPAAETFSFGPGSVTFARLQATHGYRVNISENDKGYFFVGVKGHGSTTDFATKTGRVPGDDLVADFGKRGRFDLHFVPVGRPEALPTEGCKGPKGSFQVGYLVGRARFRTERGFTQVGIHRVSAARESWAHLVCEFTGGLQFGGHPKEKRTSFSATAATSPNGNISSPPTRSLGFRATQFYRHARPAADRVAFIAELKEKEGRISIHRKVAAASGERSLLFPGAPRLPEEIATKPPAPFTGSAELLRTHESTFTWSGDLAVTFPGLDPIRLTGPRFGVTICALKGCISRGPEDDASGS